jgi:hypothetical protein
MLLPAAKRFLFEVLRIAHIFEIVMFPRFLFNLQIRIMMKRNYNRRKFIQDATFGGLGLALTNSVYSQYRQNSITEKDLTGISTIAIAAQSMQETNYDWIKNARIFIVDGYRNSPFNPKLEFDAEKLAETMVDMHANVLRVATSGNTGWLIPGTEFKVAPDLNNRDILAECINACKPHGIKVLPYLRCGGPVISEVMKPEWAQKMTPIGDIGSYPVYGVVNYPLCWNTTYRQAFYDLTKTVVSKYEVCGVYFDSWLLFYFFRGLLNDRENVCYCEGCAKGFKEASGKDLPYRENIDKYTSEELETIVHYHYWYKDEMFKVFTETKHIIKSIKDVPLIYNINNPTRILDKFQNDLRIMDGSDAVLYEGGRSIIERAEGVSLVNAHGLPIWPYVGVSEESYLKHEVYTTVAFGGSPIVNPSYFFVDQPDRRGPLKEAFKIFDSNNLYIKGFSSDTFCAVVWNDIKGSHENFSYLQSQDKNLQDEDARLCSLGSFSACLNNNIQTTSLLKIDLNNIELLNKYKVLYLPDICYLSEKQIKNIANFVENGGGLVMTYSTSLHDENGSKRTDFALGGLSKIRYFKLDEKKVKKIGSEQDGTNLYLKKRSGQSVINSSPTDRLIADIHLFETVEVLAGGKVVADLVAGPDNQPIVPGLVISRYGKGKVAYISAAFGAMYWQTNLRDLSDFIGDVIKYVSYDGVPYEIEAPPSQLITNMTVSGDKRVFHLINRSGNNPPIENVTIKFRIPSGKKIKKITSFVPIDFSQKKEKNVLHVILPRVEKYQGIVIEMG